MCQGNLDSKYLMRDIEARMKDFPVQTEAGPQKAWSFGGWIMLMLQNLRQGMAKHV
jgi:hypothetical protein